MNSAAQKPLHILLEEKLISLIQQCKTPKQLSQIQSQLTTHGLQHNHYTTPHLLNKCTQLNPITSARKLFDKIPDRSKVSIWNPILKGYLQNELYVDVVVLFREMRRVGVVMNCYTCPIVVKACVMMGGSGVRVGEEVHCFGVRMGLFGNIYFGTTLIDLYSGAGVVGDAYKVFREMSERNVVAWTAMVRGYLLCGDVVSARRIFDVAPERDIVLWNTMVSGYIEVGDMVAARRLFDKVPSRDAMCWNTVLGGYASNGDFESCERFFEEMPEKNIFSWNVLMGGYLRNGSYFEVLSAFNRMLVESDVVPSDTTLSTVLSACARLGALEFGKWVHVFADSKGYKENVSVGNALIDMYAKCGVIEDAIEVFKSMGSKDSVTWNSILGGLAMHGRGADALNLFHEMKNTGGRPNGVTFLALLSACTHMGSVEEGFSFFQTMIEEYKIVPQIEHYGCMIDLLAKAGQLDRAMDFLRKMPMEADAVIWTALLGGCRIHKHVELAEVALEKLIELEPNNPANLVMLSNIYGDAGMWKDVARLKLATRDTGSRKMAGCSLIEINDHVSEFYSFDERHPESQRIYELLMGLREVLKSFGYVPDIILENMYHL